MSDVDFLLVAEAFYLKMLEHLATQFMASIPGYTPQMLEQFIHSAYFSFYEEAEKLLKTLQEAR